MTHCIEKVQLFKASLILIAMLMLGACSPAVTEEWDDHSVKHQGEYSALIGPSNSIY